ncbi:FecR family protein [Rhizorhabdus argentea]|uniref:FecR family protein n=1 Tax=Rhizorhabdus argentea TaxID=1387174 RepID=UPI0030ED0FDA
MAPDEVAAYFVTHRVDGLTASEQNLLTDWLAEDPRHAQALDRAEGAWRSLDGADNDEILTAMRAHARQVRPERRTGWQRGVAVAATLLLFVTASVLLLPSLRSIVTGRGSGGIQVAWTQYVSAHGQVRDIKLPDGSTMTLDADSSAEARFADGRRAIRLLRGRGFFDVAKDQTRPFDVTAASRRVVALGTRFEVDLGADALRVALLRGKVAVEPLGSGARTVVLTPGQQFTEKDGAASVRSLEASNGQDEPAWRRGLLDLDDTPLDQAAAMFNRYGRDQIVIHDPTAAGMRVSGQFRATDAERFASTVGEILPIRVARRGHSIELAAAR